MSIYVERDYLPGMGRCGRMCDTQTPLDGFRVEGCRPRPSPEATTGRLKMSWRGRAAISRVDPRAVKRKQSQASRIVGRTGGGLRGSSKCHAYGRELLWYEQREWLE